MIQTFWLSFCDADLPAGQQFLGVCIVDVTDADAAQTKAFIDERFPNHVDGAEWTAAATRKAHLVGCNPGGEVASIRIDENAPADKLATIPRNRLLSRAELSTLDLV